MSTRSWVRSTSSAISESRVLTSERGRLTIAQNYSLFCHTDGDAVCLRGRRHRGQGGQWGRGFYGLGISISMRAPAPERPDVDDERLVHASTVRAALRNPSTV